MLTQDNKLLLISQVTALSGVPIRAIRYYEDLGLLKSSGQIEGGLRQFSRLRNHPSSIHQAGSKSWP
jgi:hypothetical protein